MQESRSGKDIFANYFKTWSENYRLSEMFNFDRYIAANKLNAKAVSEAWKITIEGAQTVARRQAQMLQKDAEEVIRFCKDILSPARNPEVNMSKQAEFTRASVEAVIADSREIFEMASRYNNEANEIIGRRVSEAISNFSFVGEHARQGNDSGRRGGTDSRNYETEKEAPRSAHKKAENA